MDVNLQRHRITKQLVTSRVQSRSANHGRRTAQRAWRGLYFLARSLHNALHVCLNHIHDNKKTYKYADDDISNSRYTQLKNKCIAQAIIFFVYFNCRRLGSYFITSDYC